MLEPDHTPCPITISDAAPYLGRPRPTVASWALRGWTDQNGIHHTIQPVDHKGRYNAARYWLSDLQRAELDTRESQWSQRNLVDA
jgi:hypothetical protein